MTKIHQPKVSMHAVHSLPDPGASQRARSATENAPGSGPPPAPAHTNSEVVPHARRRHFSNAHKRRILAAADRCTKPREIGALMRRRGLET
jgi:transposase